MDWLSKFTFRWHVGAFVSSEFVCFDCADAAGFGESDTDHQFCLADVCGRAVFVLVHNKGCDRPVEPGESWACPVCGKPQGDACGAEVKARVTRVG
jgi:hypothetical protein